MEPLSFEGRVAVVTGAGGGIGRAHALALASRGASVIVNDRGVSLDGRELPTSPAAAVVSEIEDAGGSAVLSTHSVANIDGATAIVGLAIEAFGGVDIVINNAGIFHYADVQNVTPARFQDMLAVHVLGPFLVTQAAWPHFLDQGYGRVLMTCSSAGLFGLSAGVHYSAAKAALVGLTRSLALEGAGHGIQVNAIAPGASTRSSQDALGGPFLDWYTTYFTPESVAAAATWLVHESCPDSGQLFAAQGGRVARITISEGPGYFSLPLTPEALRDNQELVRREDGATVIRSMEDELGLTVERLVAAGAPDPPPTGDLQPMPPPASTARLPRIL
jgi:NAD(P)-dependent dehydrogenase (short-subunit alcohol dehydrogenase family)